MTSQRNFEIGYGRISSSRIRNDVRSHNCDWSLRVNIDHRQSRKHSNADHRTDSICNWLQMPLWWSRKDAGGSPLHHNRRRLSILCVVLYQMTDETRTLLIFPRLAKHQIEYVRSKYSTLYVRSERYTDCAFIKSTRTPKACQKWAGKGISCTWSYFLFRFASWQHHLLRATFQKEKTFIERPFTNVRSWTRAGCVHQKSAEFIQKSISPFWYG
jgi:hypothetical protein